MPPSKKVIFLLHPEAIQWLRDESYRTGVSRSELVRRLLDRARAESPSGGVVMPPEPVKAATAPKNGGNGLWWMSRGGDDA